LQALSAAIRRWICKNKDVATSPTLPPTDGAHAARLFGKTRLLLLIVLIGFLVLCIVVSWTTRGAMALLHSKNGQRGATQNLVDLQPWQTAEALAPLAVSAEENEYAREAERLADHEVDQAFAAALRGARLDAQHRKLTGKALKLSQRITQLEQLKQQDQALVDSLTAKSNAPKSSAREAAQASSASDDLQVAKAQLGLDTDELADTQRELARASGDRSTEIQDELAAHEASMAKYDSQVASGETAVISVKKNHTMAARIAAWFNQNDRQSLLEQALAEAQNDVATLTAEYNALEARANSAAAAGTVQDHATQLANLKDRSILREILNIDDDRIQTDQQLASVYGKWSAQVKLQHQIVLHLILGSLMAILSILIGMLLCDALIRHLMARPAIDRRSVRTLRSILELSIQALGVVLILLVIFGSPKETPTILGLATAALTIALQDYILAFLGWFVLIGKNGIHVGDWVEINSVSGEVIEIGLMTTTLIETDGLADQGLPTGRRISFMNGFAIRGQYFNFSSAGQWMWDEIRVSVPESADIHRVIDDAQKAVTEETRENSIAAEQEWKRGERAEGLARYGVAPVVNLRPSGSGVELQIRYVTSAYGRFELRNRLYHRVVELLHEQRAPAQ
jgi:small-conductance mechanosensitive channel